MAGQKERIIFRKVRAYAILVLAALLIIGLIVLIFASGNNNPGPNPSASPTATTTVTAPGPSATVEITESPSVPAETPTPSIEPTVTNPPVNGMYEGGYCMLANDGVNFRADSNTDSEILDNLKKGTVMIVLNFNCGEAGDWTKVKLGDKIGYLKTNFLAACTMSPKCKIANVESFVNIRSQASASSEKVTECALGTEVVILRFAGDWVQVQLPDDRTGYMMKKYLEPMA
ncbi:MAG: SH3 domain-containing protein [Clostridia bacterium]|nr:SH3 domain-containing protein [Clostridia bacterium]